jgi:AraC-like DNA-binding protein
LSEACADEASIGRATAQFLQLALASEACAAPAWVPDVHQRLEDVEALTAEDLAPRLDMHPAYLARAYRAATGEGLGEMQRRRRVEAASKLLRFTRLPLAEIAVAAGFCDQSHMNRCFRAVLGRTPLTVRAETGGAWAQTFRTGDTFGFSPSPQAALDPM